jgi:uncharacterized protein YbbC (DUF1343 family)
MAVKLGIDLYEEFYRFKGKTVGLITNYSGVDSQLTDNIQVLLNHGVSIKVIFSPEHGIYGVADGQSVSDSVHPEYGIPIKSLYGEKKKPSQEDLEHLDCLVYDIQDVGLRYYTFIYTLAYCMEVAAKKGLQFYVLDRPNPLGSSVKGSRIEKKYSSFVGDYALPIRYGMTPGELAYYFKKEFNMDCELEVIKMKNYNKDMYFPDTGLLWNVPSPAIPTFESTVCYCGGCFIEATNISEGRGSPKPFQMYGAPWLDMKRMYSWLKEKDFNDFKYRKRAFVPFSSKHENKVCFGIEFFPTSNKADFLPLIIHFMKGLLENHPEDITFNQYADVSRLESLSGDDRVRDCIEGRMDLSELMAEWHKEEAAFEALIEDIRLY